MNAPLALLATFLLTSVCISPAHAGQVDQGRLVFSGAVVEPTCSVSTEETLAAGREFGKPPVMRMGCQRQSGSSAHAAAMYSSVALRLSGAETNVVLKYFDAYVKADQPDAPDPVLVTRVYE